MKPLQAELVLLYCRQARAAVTRVVELTAEERSCSGDFAQAVDDALSSISQLERQVNKATRIR